jgi:hypothetical protein
MSVDTPSDGALIAGPFVVAGWALDLADRASGSVDAVHVWARPVDGTAMPVFVGAATPVTRPDVGNVFGAEYAGSGFHLNGAVLPAGTYDLVVYARSAVTGTFNTAKVVRIIVQ